MYSKDKKEKTLQVYNQCGCVTKTIRILGYPTRTALYKWISNKRCLKRRIKSTIRESKRPRYPTIDIKMAILKRCFELGEKVKLVARSSGYSRTSIYNWKKEYLNEETPTSMKRKQKKTVTPTKGSPPNEIRIEDLQAQIADMQFEIDVLREIINVLKKDPGISKEALKSREKVVIADALKDKYSLLRLLKRLDISKSTYYYNEANIEKADKHTSIRTRITEVFGENKGRYGYRRIWGLLRRENTIVSEKVVRRVMKEEKLFVRASKKRKYNSYKHRPFPTLSTVISMQTSRMKNGLRI